MSIVKEELVRYTLNDYKAEMLKIAGKMPKGWKVKCMSKNYPQLEKGSPEYVTHSNNLGNVILGRSYMKGIQEGYINMIRECYGVHNKKKIRVLPSVVLTM